ncbi:Pentatricopeptide repeat [Parasponia andersonii]|uniref:Pentatricopeptide repeat n=1 Tax=Parasponia andersonii TaxID=3476 RepID=A0A2P5E4J5_PARAD|nr:Pentatricopeptide repeat [Parasponia andersonii]
MASVTTPCMQFSLGVKPIRRIWIKSISNSSFWRLLDDKIRERELQCRIYLVYTRKVFDECTPGDKQWGRDWISLLFLTCSKLMIADRHLNLVTGYMARSLDMGLENILMDFYATCGQMMRGWSLIGYVIEQLFRGLPLFLNGRSTYESFENFCLMRQSNAKLYRIALIGLEFEPDLLVLLMYAKDGHVTVARSFFDQMKESNEILWNTMISGYKMFIRSIKIDYVTLRSTILACAQSEYKIDIFVNTTHVDMYAKCGSLDLARNIFYRTPKKDVFVWSARIVGYGLHGRG